MSQQVQTNRIGGIGLQQFSHEDHIAKTLAHLFAVHTHHGHVRPERGEWSRASRLLALDNFAFMVGEDEISPAAVNRQLGSEVLVAQRRALDMPARPSTTPRAVPARLVGSA